MEQTHNNINTHIQLARIVLVRAIIRHIKYIVSGF